MSGAQDPKTSSPIKEFYRNKAIFITGVTGFVGKILLEKLIRACTESGPIYVLLRSKKGLSAEERLSDLLKSRTFSFHTYSKSQMDKVIPIEGDCSRPDLGISEANRQLLIKNVNVVFHSAASVRFDLKLADHLNNNLLGTKRVIALSREMHNLNCYIHVSTAFSNCQMKEIDEKLYPVPLSPCDMLTLHSLLDADSLEKVAPKLIGERPNTYIFSKALSEHLICENGKGMTIGIARPAIVAPAMREPAPGFVDTVHGPAGLSVLAGVGVVQTVDWYYHIKTDVITVDYVANGLIGMGWYCTTFAEKKATFFNLTSSNLEPMASGDFMKYARVSQSKYPSMYLVRPAMHPPKSRPHPLEYKLKKFVYHVMFAYIIDFFIGLFGYERLMVRVVNKMHRAMDLMQYFVLNEWKFTSNNFLRLIDTLSPNDRVEFGPDIRIVNTLEKKLKAIDDVWLGCRRYILNESDKTIPLARKKAVMVHFFYRLYQLCLLYMAFKIVFIWTSISSCLWAAFYLPFYCFSDIFAPFVTALVMSSV